MTDRWAGLDRITLSGLRAVGYHGVFEFEKREGQEFSVDVSIGVPSLASLANVADRDDLARTVDYGQVARLVLARITGEPVDLIETLAHLIADDVLALPRAQIVDVTVHKPMAPLTDADGNRLTFSDVTVTVTR